MLKFLNKWLKIAFGGMNMCPVTNAKIECPLHKLCQQLRNMDSVDNIDSDDWEDDHDLQITIDPECIGLDCDDDTDIDVNVQTGKINSNDLCMGVIPCDILHAVTAFKCKITSNNGDWSKQLIKRDVSQLVDDITREKLNQKKNKTKKSIEKKIASDFDIDLSDSNKNK